jgi:hypothetical protein
VEFKRETLELLFWSLFNMGESLPNLFEDYRIGAIGNCWRNSALVAACSVCLEVFIFRFCWAVLIFFFLIVGTVFSS